MITAEDVLKASWRLTDRVHRTPVTTNRSLNEACGCSVFFKCENLQRAGSFKIRGALNKLLALTAEERRRGVVAFSSGNHAQGVALAARMVGCSSVVAMPTDAPSMKVAATKGYGAEIVFYDRRKDDREAIALEIVRQSGRVLVPPYDDPAVMAGQGTAAMELFQEVSSLDAFLAPVGGGGLMAGCSTVVKGLFAGARVFGVEAEDANDTWLSLREGERVKIAPPETIADGIRNLTPGELTFPILRRNLEAILLVSDAEIVEAVRFLLFRAKLLVEPTGAVAAAALLSRKFPLPQGSRVGVILTGGNVDPDLLSTIIRPAGGICK